jgi:hypothetical protein
MTTTHLKSELEQTPEIYLSCEWNVRQTTKNAQDNTGIATVPWLLNLETFKTIYCLQLISNEK